MTEIDKLREMKNQELLELGKERARRRKPIVEAWKAAHPHSTRGTVISPEMTALEEEIRIRHKEIHERYEALEKAAAQKTLEKDEK